MAERLFYTIPIYAFWIALLIAAWSRVELWLWRRRALNHLDRWSQAVRTKADQHTIDFHRNQWQGMYAQDKEWFDRNAQQ